MFDDPIGAIIWAVVMGGFTVYAIRKERRRAEREHRVSEPISHVRPTPVDANGRPLKVGVDLHAKACDAGHKIECVCGLDDLTMERLEADPFVLSREAELRAWGELHGETGGVA